MALVEFFPDAGVDFRGDPLGVDLKEQLVIHPGNHLPFCVDDFYQFDLGTLFFGLVLDGKSRGFDDLLVPNANLGICAHHGPLRWGRLYPSNGGGQAQKKWLALHQI